MSSLSPVSPIDDLSAPYAIGITACIGFLWLIVSFFVYPGATTMPIRDLWPTIFGSWSSIAYFANWLVYLEAVIEMTAFFVYLAGDPYYMTIWTPTVNLWTSLVVYMLPWMFCLLDVGLTPNGLSTTESTATWFLFGGSAGMWIFTGIMNIMFTGRFMGHSEALTTSLPKICGRCGYCQATKDVLADDR